VAETVRVPATISVMLTEQLAELGVELASPQVTPPGVKVTVPVGVVAPDPEVSVTVAMHEVAWFTTTVPGVQATIVEVVRGVTVKANAGEFALPTWVVSPAYVAVMFLVPTRVVGV
jgi:hypothetical protein